MPLCLRVQNLGAEQQLFYTSATQTHALQEQHKSQNYDHPLRLDTAESIHHLQGAPAQHPDV